MTHHRAKLPMRAQGKNKKKVSMTMPNPDVSVPPNGAPHAGPAFYLSKLRIVGFRAIEDTTFGFLPTLNVIVGANNSGKSAVIDALRIILNLGSFQEKEDFIRLRTSDICRSQKLLTTVTISFEATFQGRDSTHIAAQFYELDANEPAKDGYRPYRLKYSVQFKKQKTGGDYQYIGSSLRGGTDFQNQVSSETLDYIKAVYLAPLRDVVNDSNRLGREVERLLTGHGDPATLAKIPSAVREKAAELIESATKNQHEEVAGTRLSKYASMYGITAKSLTFIPAGLSDDMLRSLQVVFNHGHHGPDGLGLGSNGLGINNLIYSSIVLSRRPASATDSRWFFLIEEPEAHLHPQSQESFFHELNTVADMQVFVTSHSPTITAKCDLEKIIVMGHPCEDAAFQPCHLGEILKDNEPDKKYLHKFLDVTRSQLLFANGAIFVEGVTEAMLLQVFSERLGMSLRSRGVEIVALGSNGGFEHFKRLLGSGGLSMRSAFLTDGDERPDEVPQDVPSLQKRVGEVRLETEGTIRTYSGLGTFEFELLLAALGKLERQALLVAIFEAARGGKQETKEAFAKDFMDFENPMLAYRKMKEKKAGKRVAASDWHGETQTNTEFVGRKSEIAYGLLEKLISDPVKEFAIPKYISDAIKYVCGSLDKASS